MKFKGAYLSVSAFLTFRVGHGFEVAVSTMTRLEKDENNSTLGLKFELSGDQNRGSCKGQSHRLSPFIAY